MAIYLIVVIAFAALFLVFYAVLDAVFKGRQVIRARLGRIEKENSMDEKDELSRPLFARFLQPILDDMGKAVLRVTPREFISIIEKKIIVSGKPFNLSVKDWINIEAMIIICLPVLTFAMGYYREMEARAVFLLVIIEIGSGLIIPNFILSRKAAERQKKIVSSLPDVLDLLTVSVEAGLGFDGAMAKVIERMPGPLAAELENALQEMKVGKQKKDALRDVAERINVQDFTTFVGAIIQADQLGVSIGNVLRIQSEQMRQKRKQRAQEKAMKAPIKMLLPMVLFIFPTIFSVLLGPTVIRIITAFSK